MGIHGEFNVHLAGDRVVIGDYYVQRCLLCGKLLDEGNASRLMVAVEPGEEPPPPPGFSVGAWYEVLKGNPRTTIFIEQSERPYFESDLDIPENACVRARRTPSD